MKKILRPETSRLEKPAEFPQVNVVVVREPTDFPDSPGPWVAQCLEYLLSTAVSRPRKLSSYFCGRCIKIYDIFATPEKNFFLKILSGLLKGIGNGTTRISFVPNLLLI